MCPISTVRRIGMVWKWADNLTYIAVLVTQDLHLFGMSLLLAVNRRLQVSYYAADSSYHGRGVEGVAAVVAFEDGSVFVVA